MSCVAVVLVKCKIILCFSGTFVALIGLSLSDAQLSVSLPLSSYISFSGRLVWGGFGFAVFVIGEMLFFSSLVFLFLEKKLREVWMAQLSRTILFTIGSLLFVQRAGGSIILDTPFFVFSIYVENVYTEMTQYVVLFSLFTTLSLVLAGDFILRGDAAEGPGERFYLLCGLCNFALGAVMVASVLLTISNYSFYTFPGNVYFYTQQIFFVTVDAFEVIGVFSAALGCVVIAFKKNPPKIGRGQIVGGFILMVMSAPLTFIPLQIWIDRYVFYSQILAPLDLRRIHGILPLNFNLFTKPLARKPPTLVVGMNRQKSYKKVWYINSCW